VLSAGVIVTSGDRTLAMELEKNGYGWAAGRSQEQVA
jgi:Fe-S cluster assembly ATPase SufC